MPPSHLVKQLWLANYIFSAHQRGAYPPGGGVVSFISNLIPHIVNIRSVDDSLVESKAKQTYSIVQIYIVHLIPHLLYMFGHVIQESPREAKSAIRLVERTRKKIVNAESAVKFNHNSS